MKWKQTFALVSDIDVEKSWKKLFFNVNLKLFINSCFSYAGNWELVKSTMRAKFRISHVSLGSQIGNTVSNYSSVTDTG